MSTPVGPLRVLAVEDRPAIRWLIAQYLALDGHTAELASDAREGWEKFRTARFDLVITDRALPDLPGDHLAVAIKGMAPGQPIIMLTGYGDMMQAAGEQPAGVDAVVGKPFTLAVLREAIARALAQSVTRRDADNHTGTFTTKEGP